MVNNDFQVVVMLAMTDFDEIWQAKREFNKIDLPVDTPSVRLISLADIYADHDGVSLKADDFVDPDLSKLQEYDSHQGKMPVSRYIDKDGNIVAVGIIGIPKALAGLHMIAGSLKIIRINAPDRTALQLGILIENRITVASCPIQRNGRNVLNGG